MRKVIVIGECTLDVVFPQNGITTWPLQLTGRPAGRLLNAAALVSAAGHHVSFVGEAARDITGDLIVDYLAGHGVDTTCIDRFSDGGVTSSNFVFPGSDGQSPTFVLNRHFPPCERFNAPWTRIDADDIVVFGGYFSLSDRTRMQLTEILNFAAERHALIVYLPGFIPSAQPNITRVMPAILENLEHADFVFTRSEDLATIFHESDVSRCFERNIKFYCRTLLNIDSKENVITMLHRGLRADMQLQGDAASLRSQSAAVAALVNVLMDRGISLPMLAGLSETDLKSIVGAVRDAASGD